MNVQLQYEIVLIVNVNNDAR